jgi:hypothetical protein
MMNELNISRMRRMFVAMLTLLTLTAAAGCERDNSTPTPAGASSSAVPSPEPADAALNAWLLEVLKEHNLPARVVGEWVEIGDGSVRVNGSVHGDDDTSGGTTILQLAMRLRLTDGRLIVQPVVGMGKSRDEAVAQAEASFLLGTMHAWLAAFINADEEHVQPEKRTVGGKPRLVTLGDVVTKAIGGQPKDDFKWRDQLLAEIESTDLAPGAHWIDVYHGIVSGEKREMEIQLDNARWTEMEQKMQNAPWPDNGQYTSVRLFLVVQDLDDPTRAKIRPTTGPATRPATKAH